ncbi:MAG: hypothetical protein LW830_05850 [Phenylobacterium sp.]|nr:hypothetical protein [Phenylobacterium sp.]
MNFFVYGLAGVAAIVCSFYFRSRSRTLALILPLWFALAVGIDQIGVFPVAGAWVDGDLIRFLIFGALMSLPVVSYLVLPRLAPEAHRALAAAPIWGLAGLQTYRIGGLAFLVALQDGVMPAALAISVLILDVFIAISALVVAYLLRRGRGHRTAIAWNLVGLTDFTVAVLLVAGSIFGILALSPAPSAIGQSPFVLISLFQLPLGVIIHVEMLRRLMRRRGG